MITSNALRIISIAWAFPLLCSCGQDSPETTAAPESCSRFVIDTRSAGYTAPEGATYRIMAYNGTKTSAELQFAKTGTYRLKEVPPDGGIAELTPCRLNDQGEYLEDIKQGELDGLNANYYLVFVSPGVKNNDDGSFNICPKTDKFIASELPELKNIGAYGRITMNRPMKEYRSRIGFKFYKSSSDAVNQFEITNLRIAGAGNDDEKVKLFPACRQVEASADGAISIILTNESESGTTDNKGNRLMFMTKEEDMATIVPAIYAPKSVVAEVLKTTAINNLRESNYLTMNCTMTQGGRNGVAVVLPLTVQQPEMKPQNNYIYHIVVSSNYINLTVDVYDDNGNDWEAGGSEGATIGPSDTIYLGTWKIVSTSDGNGWELVRLPEQTI